jgi:glycosyltransferase involved in cell wall biosynthesis
MIKIAYNYQTFTYQKYGGISRIFSNIAPIIDQYDDFDVEVYAGLYQNHYLANNLKIRRKGLQISYPYKTTRFFVALNHIFTKIALETDQPDIVHETYYSIKSSAPKHSKTVITVLDMIHEKFIDSIGNTKFFKELLTVKAKAIERADSIICISENTKKDLLEILDIDPAKISVVYLGNSIDNTIVMNSEPIIPEPYILYVGITQLPYKNFDRLLSAYSNNKHLRKNFKLVCFGQQPFSKNELDMINEKGLNENNVVYHSGSDSSLANIYTHAAAFVYPSLYEGFGIPPLEAMSFDCPVVCSNTSSMPEVVGKAGEYFDPYNIDSISESIEKVVFSSTLTDKLISRGRERVKLFSWEKCAKETQVVYRNTINN